MAPLLVNTGKAILTARLIGTTPSQLEPKFLGIGTGATAEAITQTALVTEVETRIGTNAFTQVTTTTTNDTAQCVQTITAGTARAVTEAGLFDAVTTGNMLVRGVFSVINLAIGDSIQVTWKLQFS